MDFIVERNIPFIKGLLEPYGTVRYLAASDITPEAMATADALITRTRTRCDERLLSGSRCSIIASATIGLDHVDTGYCRNHGIEVANAPGCNAPAVAQYVFASVITLLGSDLRGRTIGVIGAGHVGSIVVRWARALGMDVLVSDPPRAEAEGPDGFCSLAEIADKADVVTVHTPYTTEGPHATHHLLGSELLGSLKRRPIVINSSRGAVADTAALKRAHKAGLCGPLVIDCWEGEPAIDHELLEMASIATPHIAGYSRQGKVRATRMALEAVCRHFSLPVPRMAETVAEGAPDRVTAEAVLGSYDPMTDTAALKSHPGLFERMRNEYALREEVK